jgi:hypothetical protein
MPPPPGGELIKQPASAFQQRLPSIGLFVADPRVSYFRVPVNPFDGRKKIFPMRPIRRIKQEGIRDGPGDVEIAIDRPIQKNDLKRF